MTLLKNNQNATSTTNTSPADFDTRLDRHRIQLQRHNRLFREIMSEERVEPAFQPIIDLLRRDIFGYEALIRGPRGSALEHPAALFSHAALCDMEAMFEILCRKKSIQRYAELGLEGKLFLNISPSALTNPGFRKGQTLECLTQFQVSPEDVVIEVTETQKTHDMQSLKQALRYYRDLGFKVALDDLGTGYSGLRLWSEVLPDYIKIDKHFIRNIHRNRVKASFVAGLVDMAAASNSRIIGEGVETREEFERLAELGLPYAQGFYFARPRPDPAASLPPGLFGIQGPRPLHAQSHGGDSVLRITRTIPFREPDTPTRKILEQFQQEHDLELLPIVERGRPLGIVDRPSFFNLLMETHYGKEVYGKYPISRFVNTDVMMVDKETALESVSRRITSVANSEPAFVVTSEGRYYGVATVLDLLGEITEQKIQNARHANPLTLLPGVVPVNRAIDDLLEQNLPFSVAYFDMDNFKPYNDCYGYEAGDRVIQLLATLLTLAYPPEQAMVGHIGGDDFIVVDSSGEYLAHCRRVLDRFAGRVRNHYRRRHLEAGGIDAPDRQGRMVLHPLLSLSVGIVPPRCAARCRSHIEISDLASEAKKQAKRRDGNTCFVNRRRPTPSP